MRTLTFFGHPLHQTLTDIPIGLWILSLAWQWVALATGSEFWWAMAFWSLVVGTLSALPVGLIGYWDFSHIARGSPAKLVGIYHALSASTAAGCFAASLLAQGGPNPPQPDSVFLVLALSTAGVFFLGVAVWYGQELILRHGLGRLVVAYTGPERRARQRETLLR